MPSNSFLRATVHSKQPAPRRGLEKPRLVKIGIDCMRSRIDFSSSGASGGSSSEYGAKSKPGARGFTLAALGLRFEIALLTGCRNHVGRAGERDGLPSVYGGAGEERALLRERNAVPRHPVDIRRRTVEMPHIVDDAVHIGRVHVSHRNGAEI